MTEVLKGWNSERVTMLAPDSGAAKRSRTLAAPKKWQVLGTDGYSVWGEIKGSGSSPYQVKMDLLRLQQGETAVACTCVSRVQPCKHGLALLFLAVESPEALTQGTAPQYIQEWLDKHAQRARKQAEKQKSAAVKAVDPKTIEARKAKIRAGLDELELWFTNILRHGLADPQLKNYRMWDDKAARMVDAQAPGVAEWLKTMGSISAKGSADWIEDLLDNMSRVYLLMQAFKRFDALSEDIQADLRMALGWPQKKEEIQAGDNQRDEWVVIGKHEGEQDRLRIQRLWLRGRNTGKDALILEFAYGDAPFETYLAPGWSIDAELAFFPGAYPLRAFICNTFNEIHQSKPITGRTITESIQAYSAALAKNPWMIQFPFFLEAVIPTRYSGKWIVRDTNGDYLPLAAGFSHKWSLFALSGYRPIQVAGEWNGDEFLPTGAIVEGRFIDFNIVGTLL